MICESTWKPEKKKKEFYCYNGGFDGISSNKQKK